MNTIDEVVEAIRQMRQRGHQYDQITTTLITREKVSETMVAQALSLCVSQENEAKRAAAAAKKKSSAPAKDSTANRKTRQATHAVIPAFGCIEDEAPIDVAL